MGKIYNKAIEDRNKKREEKFEEEHLGEITEHMIELAYELMIEPRNC